MNGMLRGRQSPFGEIIYDLLNSILINSWSAKHMFIYMLALDSIQPFIGFSGASIHLSNVLKITTPQCFLSLCLVANPYIQAPHTLT